ncbi:MAG TPA: polysaccharide biosynthesis tyrosine autokinase, partial [Thermoanaerobaculia bacterium]
GHLADQLRSGLAVEPVRNTQLVTLSYRHSSPDFAARAANGFAEAFIDMGIEDRYASAGKTSSFLGTQIETLKKEIDQKEAKLQAFSRKTDIVTLEPGNNVTLQRLEALNANYIEAKKARIEKEAEFHQTQSTPKERLSDNAAISELRAEQAKLERDYDTKLKTFKPDWPAMVDLQTQIEKGRQHIQAVVTEGASQATQASQAAYQSALRQEQNLEAEINKLKSTAMDESSDAVEYNNLKVEVKTRRDLLDELLRKQSETEVTARLQDTRDTNVRIVDRALTPGAPFYPSLRKSLSSGLIVGLMLGMGLALLIEFLDRTIKTPEEVERRFGLPTLAVIPDMADADRGYGYVSRSSRSRSKATNKGRPVAAWLEKKTAPADSSHVELVPHVRPRTPIAEAYRALRTSLLLSSANELKVIAITSAEAGEGKTATTSNLAVVLAQLGMQVLVVDADLRKPRQHHIFRLSNRFGLVNYLTGTTVNPDSVFLRTEVPNLWLTPSGPLPPNPSELLASERMREWLILVRKRFDFVLVDTPPALAVTDSILVGAIVDGVVITLRNGKVTREDARACRDRLRLAGVRLLGVVLNRYFVSHGAIGKRYRYYEAYGTYDGAPQPGPQAGSAA